MENGKVFVWLFVCFVFFGERPQTLCMNDVGLFSVCHTYMYLSVKAGDKCVPWNTLVVLYILPRRNAGAGGLPHEKEMQFSEKYWGKELLLGVIRGYKECN